MTLKAAWTLSPFRTYVAQVLAPTPPGQTIVLGPGGETQRNNHRIHKVTGLPSWLAKGCSLLFLPPSNGLARPR